MYCSTNVINPWVQFQKSQAAVFRFDQSMLNIIIVRDFGKEVFQNIFDSILNEMKVVKHPSKMYTK